MSQFLTITPDKVLEIPVTLYTSSTAELLLENTSFPFVAFKIKTTAPKNYIVRPSTGVLVQGAQQVVQIVLQPFRSEPPRNSPDRFLVQSTCVESDAPLPRDYWTSLGKSQVEDARLSVVLKTIGTGAEGSAENGSPTMNDLSARDHIHSHEANANGGGSVSAPDGLEPNGAHWKGHYEQVVEYALAMERHKEDLGKENESLKKQLESRTQNKAVFEIWHIPIYIFVLVMLWYLYGLSSAGKSAAQN